MTISKKIILGLVLLSFKSLFAMNPTIINANFHTSYIPNGFDTNDHIQLVGEGTFSSDCYRPAKYEVDVKHDLKKVYITPKAYEYNAVCSMMLVPYSQVIDVGLLKVGNYEVVQTTDSQLLGNVNVKTATNSEADDFLYAPVSQAMILNQNTDKYLLITGQFTNSCMKLVDTMVDVQSNVVVVQPLAELEEGVMCAQGMFPFSAKVKLNNINKGRYLLHVRSLNATSINNLVDIY